MTKRSKPISSAANPIAAWVTQYGISLDELPEPLNVPQPDHPTIRQRQQAFGYTVEELKMVITPMVVTGEEADLLHGHGYAARGIIRPAATSYSNISSSSSRR